MRRGPSLAISKSAFSNAGWLSQNSRKPGEPAVSYNGFPFTLTAAGCRESAADRMGPGYITRAILVDMPLLKQVSKLQKLQHDNPTAFNDPRKAIRVAIVIASIWSWVT